MPWKPVLYKGHFAAAWFLDKALPACYLYPSRLSGARDLPGRTFMNAGKAIVGGAVVALVCSSLLLAQASQDDKRKKKDKPGEKPKTEEKAGDTKLFQLDEIIIDVIEKARDAESRTCPWSSPSSSPSASGRR
jgi:hypothetical protein